MDAQKIYQEKVNSVFAQLPIVLRTDVIAGTMLFVFAVFIPQTQNPFTYYWFVVLLLVNIVGFIGNHHYKKLTSQPENTKSRERFLMLTALLSGLLWGNTWVMAPFSAEALLQAPKGASLLWACAMLASAVINLSTIRKLFFCFAIPTIFCQVGFLLYHGSERDLQLASALPLVLVFISFLAMRVNVDLNRAIKLKLQNKLLDAELREEKIELELRKEELFKRIEREKELLAEKIDVDSKLAMAAKEKLLLLDAVGEGIFGVNSAGNISFVNAMALQLLHYEEAEVIGKNALETLSRSNSKTGKEAATRLSINACLLQGKPVQSVGGVFCGKGDVIIPVTFSCRPISEDGALIGAVVSFFDMTKQLEMEAKLLQSQKMEAIGRITGGVAHDFNNLLTVIMGNLQFLKRRLTSDGRLGETEIIDNLVKAAKNGADLNKRLLSFSKEQALLSKAEDINSLLTDMEGFLYGVLGEDIELELSLSEESNTVKIDRTQFENVIVNLCVNAKDAMPKGGKVTIRTRNIQLTEPPSSTPVKAGAQEYVELTVTDNGMGIPAEIQDKIFDPFFTTKAMGEGSGFGLSTAFGFLQQSGGNITVRSRQGEWTTFTLHIPLANELLKSRQQETSSEDLQEQYNGTILLVEDDSGVRDVAAQMLLEAGFKVIAANDGNSGLERFNNNPGIDLVFSDIMMPGGMNGIDMAKLILKEKPRTPILLATGYTQQILKDKIEESDNITCISKPYDTNKLPELINSMLVIA